VLAALPRVLASSIKRHQCALLIYAGAIWTPLLVFDTLTEGYAHDLGEVPLIAAALHGRVCVTAVFRMPAESV